MKHQLMNYSTQIAQKLELDLVDLVLLQWFDNYINQNLPKSQTVDEVIYYHFPHSIIFDDLLIINLKKRTLVKRINKLIEAKLLKRCSLKKRAFYSFYAFGENYQVLKQEEQEELEDIGDFGNSEDIEDISDISENLSSIDDIDIGNPENDNSNDACDLQSLDGNNNYNNYSYSLDDNNCNNYSYSLNSNSNNNYSHSLDSNNSSKLHLGTLNDILNSGRLNPCTFDDTLNDYELHSRTFGDTFSSDNIRSCTFGDTFNSGNTRSCTFNDTFNSGNTRSCTFDDTFNSGNTRSCTFDDTFNSGSTNSCTFDDTFNSSSLNSCTFGDTFNSSSTNSCTFGDTFAPNHPGKSNFRGAFYGNSSRNLVQIPYPTVLNSEQNNIREYPYGNNGNYHYLPYEYSKGNSIYSPGTISCQAYENLRPPGEHANLRLASEAHSLSLLLEKLILSKLPDFRLDDYQSWDFAFLELLSKGAISSEEIIDVLFWCFTASEHWYKKILCPDALIASLNSILDDMRLDLNFKTSKL